MLYTVAMADTIETLKRNISTNASALQTQAQSAASNAVDISRTELDKRFPPEQRADVAHSVKGWIAQHPALFVYPPTHQTLDTHAKKP